MPYSDYIVFVDESGDHNLEQINPEFPLFVLAFCVFRKEDYVNAVVPQIQAFKMRWFGHDMAVLHERDIRRDLPPFAFLKSRERKGEFVAELGRIIEAVPMYVIYSVIFKDRLKDRYVTPHNPYHLSLLFCMERLRAFLYSKSQAETHTTHLIFEQRGGKAGGGEEDRILELEFRRIMDGQNKLSRVQMSGMKIIIAPKITNSIGLQVADLIARPIGLHHLRPEQPNNAWDIIRPKIGMCQVFP